MKVVLLGGSGRIGRALTASLLADGHAVVVLSRTPKGAGSQRVGTRQVPGCRVVGWTATDLPGLAAALSGSDAVANLAGAPVGPWPWTAARRRMILDSRLGPTSALVAALASLELDDRPSVLVSVSGTDRYTDVDATEAVESTPSGEGFLAIVCAAWEAHARVAEQLGLRVVILRIGFVIAQGGPIMRLFALPFRVGLGGPLGSGRQWFSWVHLDDVIGLTRAALADDRYEGAINVTAPTPVRQSDLAAAIGRVLHRPARLRTPAWLIRLVMGDVSTLALGSRRVVPARALERGYRFRWTDLDAALRSAFLGEQQ